MNTEFTFKFDEAPQKDFSFDFKFCEAPNYMDFCGYDLNQQVALDQDSVKQYKSTVESTDSERCADYHLDELSPVVVPFIGDKPHLGELERIVNLQILERGYNNVVLDCLDMSTEDEIEEENQEIIRKKQKKSRTQVRALKSEFRKRPHWTKRFMKKLAKDLGLSTSQVYKWHWDQTKKSSSNTSKTPSVSHKRVKTCE